MLLFATPVTIVGFGFEEFADMGEQNNPYKILMVEDDSDDRLLLALELQGSGLEKAVYYFSDVDELVGFYSLKKPSRRKAIILLNLFLPKYDLHQAIAAIKSVGALRSVPIIVMLGSPGEENYFHESSLEVSGYVVKPLSLQQLRQTISLLKKPAHRQRSNPYSISQTSG